MAYCASTDLDLIYGQINVDAWADTDGNKDATYIANRRTWACDGATDYLDSRLVDGPYDFPLASSPYPITIVNMATWWAGILLHDARAITSEAPDQVARQRTLFETYVRQILRGQLKLIDPTSGEELEKTINTPSVVS